MERTGSNNRASKKRWIYKEKGMRGRPADDRWEGESEERATEESFGMFSEN